MFFPRFDETAFLRYVDRKAAEGALTKEINEEVIRIKEHKEMRREYMTRHGAMEGAMDRKRDGAMDGGKR